MFGGQTSVLFLLILAAYVWSSLRLRYTPLYMNFERPPPPFLFWLSKAHTHSNQGTSHTELYDNSDPDAGHQVAIHIYPPIPAVYSHRYHHSPSHRQVTG
ncbi:hypothetical protein GDO81_021156 [Engystomops pustulosus]|uniref:Secreted protein n=1 Tax=Engystomops pustulosus TaxID=76066 RepID=A0AAV6YZT3_ENGPU|nr:hypothetical protein GDO81_021156 [Engystomops pustulosus]